MFDCWLLNSLNASFANNIVGVSLECFVTNRWYDILAVSDVLSLALCNKTFSLLSPIVSSSDLILCFCFHAFVVFCLSVIHKL